MDMRKIWYQILITLVFSLLAFLTRYFNLITPLGDIFVLDLRDFFVAIGAAIGGPVPGFIIGFMAGVPAKIPAIDIAAFSIAGLTVGFFSNYFYRKGIDVAYSAVFMLVGYLVAFLMVISIYHWPIPLGLFARALICIPINVFILHYLLQASPKILAVARYAEEGERESSPDPDGKK
jgi:LytS/YehU family sensor histidine kinase